MPGYFIAQIKIKDPESYERYLDGFDEIFDKYDAEVLLVDDAPTVLEGKWAYTRVVVIRFASEEEARRWYYSPEYQELAKLRQKASDCDIILAAERE